MPVELKKPAYVSHGKEFPTADAAKRFDAVYEARVELEDAQRKFQRALAESALTADGFFFDFGVFRDYWRIARPFGCGQPHLRKTCYVCWSWSVREDGKTVEIIEEVNEPRERGRFTPINELYADEAIARKALADAMRAWAEEVNALVAATIEERHDLPPSLRDDVAKLRNPAPPAIDVGAAKEALNDSYPLDHDSLCDAVRALLDLAPHVAALMKLATEERRAK